MKILGFDEEGMEWFKHRFKIAFYWVVGLWIFLSLLFWLIWR